LDQKPFWWNFLDCVRRRGTV